MTIKFASCYVKTRLLKRLLDILPVDDLTWQQDAMPGYTMLGSGNNYAVKFDDSDLVGVHTLWSRRKLPENFAKCLEHLL